MEKAIASKKGVQGKQLMPHEVVAKFMGFGLSSSEADLLGAQWDSLREGVVEALAIQVKVSAGPSAAGLPAGATRGVADNQISRGIMHRDGCMGSMGDVGPCT